MDQGQMAKLLDELGTTPDEVAASLKANGVRGVRNAARFLNIIVRHFQDRILVDACALDMMQKDRLRLTLGNGSTIHVGIPEPVRLFLDAFNEGQHSDLELSSDGT